MGMDSFRPTTDRFDLVRNALRRIEQCVLRDVCITERTKQTRRKHPQRANEISQ